MLEDDAVKRMSRLLLYQVQKNLQIVNMLVWVIHPKGMMDGVRIIGIRSLMIISFVVLEKIIQRDSMKFANLHLMTKKKVMDIIILWDGVKTLGKFYTMDKRKIEP